MTRFCNDASTAMVSAVASAPRCEVLRQVVPLASADAACSRNTALSPACARPCRAVASMLRHQVILFKEGTDTLQGKAQLISNTNACTAKVDAVRKTFGPRGMHKLIHDDKSTNISKNGATITKLLDVVHPTAEVLVDNAKSQDSEKDNGHANYCTATIEDKQKGSEGLVKDASERANVLQTSNKIKDNIAVLVRTASAVATTFTLLACYQAWAGPEIASVQDAATWWRDIDDIKSGFVSAFLLIFFSEIGDKTFFIAAVLASRKSMTAVFTGTLGALVSMTFISVFLGRTFHYIDGLLPFSLGETELPLDDLAAVVLLVYFGVTTLLEAASMEGSKAEEEQQEAELAIAGLGPNGKGSTIKNTALATFGLVFVAEWGDKSFFSTVALSAASSPVGVVSGAVAGHGLATLLAVVGGSFLSSYISEKVTGYIGGSLFLVFAAFTLFEIFS